MQLPVLINMESRNKVSVLILLLMLLIPLSSAQNNDIKKSSIEIADYYEVKNTQSTLILSNEYIKLYLYHDGNFKIYTSTDKPLTYPSDTSDFGVKVDGKVYRIEFGGSYLGYYTRGPELIDSQTVFIDYNLDNITVRNIFKLIGDNIRFETKVWSTDGKQHYVEVLYFIDTQLGPNDGSPLYAPGYGVFTHEVQFLNPDFRYWMAYDFYPNPSLQAYGTLITKPKKIVFAHWPTANDYLWDYNADPNRRFYTPGYNTSPNSDSCVLIYYDLGSVGESSKTIEFFYGLSLAGGGTSRNEKIEIIKTYLELYGNKILEKTKEWVRNMAKADTRLYVKYGTNYTKNVLKFYEYKMGKITLEELPGDIREFVLNLDYVEIHKNNSSIERIYEFYKEMFSRVNENMNEEEITEVFYAYYMGTYPNQKNKFFGINMEEFLNVYRIKYLEAVDITIKNISNSQLTEQDLDAIISGIKKSIEEIEIPMNDSTIVEKILKGESFQIKITRVELNPLPFGVLAVSILSTPIDDILIWAGIGALVAGVSSQVVTFFASGNTINILSHTITGIVSSGISSGSISNLGIISIIPKINIDFEKLSMLRWLHKKIISDATRYVSSTSEIAEKIDEFYNFKTCVEIEDLYFYNYSILHGNVKGEGYISINNKCSKNFYSMMSVMIKGPTSGVVSFKDNNVIEIKPGENKFNFYFAIEPKPYSDWTSAGIYTATVNLYYILTFSPEVTISDLEFPDIEYPLPIEFPIRIGIPLIFYFKSYSKAFQIPDFGCRAEIETIERGMIEEGEERTTFMTLSGDRTLIMLHYGGSDLDLHLYDSHGRHVGLNYLTGEVELEIPNVLYSGPDKNPEWILIMNNSNDTFKLKVLGVSTDGSEYYSIDRVTLLSSPVRIYTVPSKISVIGDHGVYFGELWIWETGGFNSAIIDLDIENLISASGIINTTFINLTPKTFYIDPSGIVRLNYTIEIPADIPPDRYVGRIIFRDAYTREILGETEIEVFIPKGKIYIKVYDEFEENIDARITIGNYHGINSTATIYFIEGTYDLRIEKEGYVPVFAKISIKPGESKSITVKLYREENLTTPRAIMVEGTIEELNELISRVEEEFQNPNAVKNATKTFNLTITNENSLLAISMPIYKSNES
ncbi:MAG: PEGA domain-containing protein, partial [Candidatus Methanomethylicia archaeon]